MEKEGDEWREGERMERKGEKGRGTERERRSEEGRGGELGREGSERGVK